MWFIKLGNSHIKKSKSTNAFQKDKSRRHLIASSDKSTWRTESACLFLGTWCFSPEPLLGQKHEDHVVLDYHLAKPAQIEVAGAYIDNLYEQLLVNLSLKLNEIHGVDWELKSWRILIGPWLHRHIEIYYDRWTTIENALNEYTLKSHCLPVPTKEQLIPENYDELGETSKTNEWNDLVYGLIIKEQDSKITQIPPHSPNISTSIKGETYAQPSLKQNYISKLIRIVRKLASSPPTAKILSRIIRNNNFFLFDYYTPRKADRFIIDIYFNNLNFLLSHPINKIPEAVNWQIRENVCPPFKANTKFEKFLIKQLPRMVPKVYLEGFSELLRSTQKKIFPIKPKVIVTATGQWTSDVFRAWCAIKTSEGTSLIIQQHGACYGTATYSFFEQHELAICDRYLSWGWGNTHQKIRPVTAPINYLRKSYKYDKLGQILIICDIAGMHLSQLQSDTHFAQRAEEYLIHVIQVLEILTSSTDRPVAVKLFPNDHERGKPLAPIIASEFPDVKLIEETESLTELILSSSLCVHTYNGTPFLECFPLSHPSILANNLASTPVRKTAHPFFEQLKNVGIYHEDTESIKKFLNKNADNIQQWWKESDVIEARRIFSKEFVFYSGSPRHSLIKNIKEPI
jgi:putative transferase (TIGR04331 family)